MMHCPFDENKAPGGKHDTVDLMLPNFPSTADQTFLDEVGFEFVSRCIGALEKRGLEEQGLYRIVGVSSKVAKLLTMGLDKRKREIINFEDALEWETKTLTSAVKTYFRNLPEPILTFSLHQKFIDAVKLENCERRVSEVRRVAHMLPEPNKRMLHILLGHLSKICEKSSKNLMSVSNLGVVFGPTLLRSEDESVAAIMEIKFANGVVEILIQNGQQILQTKPTNPHKSFNLHPHTPTNPHKPLNLHPRPHTPLKNFKGRPRPTSTSPSQVSQSSLTTHHPHLTTQTCPPRTSSKPPHQTPTLITAVIFDGPKIHQQVQNTKSTGPD